MGDKNTTVFFDVIQEKLWKLYSKCTHHEFLETREHWLYPIGRVAYQLHLFP